jgi:hypothetical protein
MGNAVIWVPEFCSVVSRCCSREASTRVPAFERIQVYEALLIFVTVIVSPSILPVTFTLSPAYFAKPGAS